MGHELWLAASFSSRGSVATARPLQIPSCEGARTSRAVLPGVAMAEAPQTSRSRAVRRGGTSSSVRPERSRSGRSRTLPRDPSPSAEREAPPAGGPPGGDAPVDSPEPADPSEPPQPHPTEYDNNLIYSDSDPQDVDGDLVVAPEAHNDQDGKTLCNPDGKYAPPETKVRFPYNLIPSQEKYRVKNARRVCDNIDKASAVNMAYVARKVSVFRDTEWDWTLLAYGFTLVLMGALTPSELEGVEVENLKDEDEAAFYEWSEINAIGGNSGGT